MTHTVEVVLPHFSVKLFQQTRRIIFSIRDLNPELHAMRIVKESAGPYSDLYGRNATEIDMPRDRFGHVEFSLKFNKPDGSANIRQHLGYTLVVCQKEMWLEYAGEQGKIWSFSEISTMKFDMSPFIKRRMAVQLAEALSVEKSEMYVDVPVSASYTTLPADSVPDGARISIYNLPNNTYLPAGAYIAGDYMRNGAIMYRLP
jgi:hypothetical protein